MFGEFARRSLELFPAEYIVPPASKKAPDEGGGAEETTAKDAGRKK